MNFVKTPIGDLIARLLIKLVSHIPKRGVMIKDSHNHMLAYIAVSDDTLALKVRDLFNEFVEAGRNAKQPDWSFLLATAPAPAPASASAPAPAPAPALAPAPAAAKAKKLPKEPSDDSNTAEV